MALRFQKTVGDAVLAIVLASVALDAIYNPLAKRAAVSDAYYEVLLLAKKVEVISAAADLGRQWRCHKQVNEPYLPQASFSGVHA